MIWLIKLLLVVVISISVSSILQPFQNHYLNGVTVAVISVIVSHLVDKIRTRRNEMAVKKKIAMTEEQLLHVAMIVYTLYVLYLLVTKNFVPRFITPYGLYLFVLVEEKLEKFCKKLYHNLMNR